MPRWKQNWGGTFHRTVVITVIPRGALDVCRIKWLMRHTDRYTPTLSPTLTLTRPTAHHFSERSCVYLYRAEVVPILTSYFSPPYDVLVGETSSMVVSISKLCVVDDIEVTPMKSLGKSYMIFFSFTLRTRNPPHLSTAARTTTECRGKSPKNQPVGVAFRAINQSVEQSASCVEGPHHWINAPGNDGRAHAHEIYGADTRDINVHTP